MVESGTFYQHFLAMSNELNTPKILLCPDDKSRKTATSFTTKFSNVNISYFVGMDVDGTQPSMFISGDDNFTINGKKPKPGLLQFWTNSPDYGQRPGTSTKETLVWPTAR